MFLFIYLVYCYLSFIYICFYLFIYLFSVLLSFFYIYIYICNDAIDCSKKQPAKTFELNVGGKSRFPGPYKVSITKEKKFH